MAIALYFVASFIVAQATLLSLGCSLVIGSIVGVRVCLNSMVGGLGPWSQVVTIMVH